MEAVIDQVESWEYDASAFSAFKFVKLLCLVFQQMINAFNFYNFTPTRHFLRDVAKHPGITIANDFL